MAKNGKAAKPDKPKKGRKADPEREAERKAQKEKRVAQLKELQEKDLVKFRMKVNFREAKEFKLTVGEGEEAKPIESWKDFCNAKATWAGDYWRKMADKPQASEKSIERKKAAFAKLQERMAKYQKELESLGIKLDDGEEKTEEAAS